MAAMWPSAASAYQVQPGDTLSAIAQRTGVAIGRLVEANHLQNPNLIYAGQQLTIPNNSAPASTPPAPTTSVAARDILVQAARDHGLRPAFVLALSWWESGWQQSMVSRTGAVGLMQIQPETASWAGPAYLGRRVDLGNPHDNAELGAAMLRDYLERFDDPKLALAAYYQGPNSIAAHGIYPSSQAYVNGIWSLRNRFAAEGY